MKKLLSLICVLSLASTFFSCKKDADHANKLITINQTLSSGETYSLKLNQFGDADDIANIIKQAASFSVSSIDNPNISSASNYTFSSVSKSAEAEQVVLAITEANRGNRRGKLCEDATIITINFVIK